MSYYHHLIKSGASYTARTTAFATATAITDTTILNALNTFDLGLISNGLDTKMKALYPFVGGAAATHKFNFMDARDLDAAFRLQFNGGWTHSANGIQGNGTNAYANTYLPPNVMAQNSIHMSIYSRTNNDALVIDIGSENNTSYTDLLCKYNNEVYGYSNSTSSGLRDAVTDSLGLFNLVRTSSISNKIFKNNVRVTSNNASSTTPNQYSLYISAVNSLNSASLFANRQYAFSSIGDGLTDTDASNLYTLVQAFQTSLTRNV